MGFYQAHVGDLYYDNATGYAYRFSKTGTANPDVVANYKWVQISDGAATAALAAASTAQASADGKMTYFTASNLTELNALSPKIGDVLIPSATITDTAPDPDEFYYIDTIYTYDGTD